MSENKIRNVSPFLFTFEGLNIHGFIVLYGPAENFASYGTKKLFSLLDVEKALGFSRQGWHWTRTVPKIRIQKKGYTDAETILKGIKSLTTTRKSQVNFKTLQSWMNDIAIQEKSMGFANFGEIRKIWPISVKLEAYCRELVQFPSLMAKENCNCCEIDAAKEINGNQAFEFIKTVHPGNEIADAFNNVFDSAKEITLYGELMHEGKALTNEMSELRVKIADLTQKLNDKEIVFQQNQKKIAEMKQILASNPLLKITEVSKKEEEINELKDKLERLESENKAMKDRIGEGENFKTAAMFPNKKQYFVGDELKINNALGIALSRMAKKKGITISKVRSGSQEVGVYPIYLHNVLSAWIQNKERNEYMDPLQPYLKPEYKSTLNVTNYQPEYKASV
jgi:hypothetical protein